MLSLSHGIWLHLSPSLENWIACPGMPLHSLSVWTQKTRRGRQRPWCYVHDVQTVRVLRVQDGPWLNTNNQDSNKQHMSQTEKDRGAEEENCSTFLCKTRGFKCAFLIDVIISSFCLQISKVRMTSFCLSQS